MGKEGAGAVEYVAESVGGHGPGEAVALRGDVAQREQLFGLFGGFDALGDRVQSQRLGQVDDARAPGAGW